MPLRRTGTPIFFEAQLTGAPALQRTAPQVLRAALRPGHGSYAAAAIDFKNPSISACRLVVDSDNCFADDSN